MQQEMMLDAVRAGVVHFHLGIDAAASVLGVPGSEYRRIMQGERDISDREFLHFCAVLHEKPQTLLAMGVERAGRSET